MQNLTSKVVNSAKFETSNMSNFVIATHIWYFELRFYMLIAYKIIYIYNCFLDFFLILKMLFSFFFKGARSGSI
jgi:hypothetical protein